MRRRSHRGPAYEALPCLCEAVKLLASACSILSHIDPSRVYCVVSRGSSSRAYARIHGLSRAWTAVGVGPAYLIEVVYERFARLTPRGRLRVLIHELLHIPYTFSGALRPHGALVSGQAVSRVLSCLEEKGLTAAAESGLSLCPPTA